MNFIGAEAIITETTYNNKKAVIKKRIKKKYRPKKLDSELIKKRTKLEASILKKAKRISCNVPEILKTGKNTIIMEKIKGKTLSEIKPQKKLFEQTGMQTGILHNHGIIHSDLTPKNIMVHNKKIYLIDFGLGFYSHRKEDFAVELLAFQKAVSRLQKSYFNAFLKGYKKTKSNSKEIIAHIEKIRKRARYTEK